MDFRIEDESELFKNGVVLVISPDNEVAPDDGIFFSYISPDAELVSLGQGRYQYTFQTSHNLLPGRYRVEAIFLTDTAGNTSFYNLKDSRFLNSVMMKLIDYRVHVRRDPGSEAVQPSTYWINGGYYDEDGVLHLDRKTELEELYFDIEN